jgi:peptidoglycan/LPS O-acetylase OafA/YrhL
MTMPMAGTREEVALPPRGHLLALDGVRGLAILMVICSHAFESNSDSAGPLVRLIGRLFFYGYFGVDLFFALSGFLASSSIHSGTRGTSASFTRAVPCEFSRCTTVCSASVSC